MTTLRTVLIVTAMFMIVEIVLIYNQSMYHELTHAAIFKTIGNCDTKIEPYYNSVLDYGMKTYAENCTYANQEEVYLSKSLNLQNEIAGYNITGIILAILSTGLIMTLVWLIEKPNTPNSPQPEAEHGLVVQKQPFEVNPIHRFQEAGEGAESHQPRRAISRSRP